MNYDTAMSQAKFALEHTEEAIAPLRFISTSADPEEAYKAGYGIEYASAAVHRLEKALVYAQLAFAAFKSLEESRTKTKAIDVFPNAWSVVDREGELVGEIQTDGSGGFNVIDPSRSPSILKTFSQFDEAEAYARKKFVSKN